MKNFYRVMLDRKSIHAKECLNDNFIGVDFGVDIDLTNDLTERFQDFSPWFRPKYLEKRPEKTKVAAGLAAGAVWTVCKGIRVDDIVICPDGQQAYLVGKVTGPYSYKSGRILPHRRPIDWFPNRLTREDMSVALRNSAGSALTTCDVSKYAEELEALIGGQAAPALIASDETVEDPSVFALEKHLEEFLVANWANTELGQNYDIFEEDGELVGQQYPSDTGPIDILAISKDKKELLVVELKKGRASDSVVGQIQRYMGFVLGELAEPDQTVKGVIIALEDDLRIRRALAVTSNIDFYRYEVSFALKKAE